MADMETIDLRHMARSLSIPLRQVQAVVELLDDGNTVPFITRYRKDQTGGLDEEQIRRVRDRIAKMRLLMDRKQTILRSVESQGKLTEELAKQIRSAGTTKRLEDLYLPYKPKKQTLATVARQGGLEPLAGEILRADAACGNLDARAADFVSPDRQVPTAAGALLGAGHILAEQFSENPELRQQLRDILQRTGSFVCSRIGGDPKPAEEKPESQRQTKQKTELEAVAEVAAETVSHQRPSPDASSRPGPVETPETANTTESAAEEPVADGDTDNSPETAASSDDASSDEKLPEVSAESSAEQETPSAEESAGEEVAAEEVVEEAAVAQPPAEAQPPSEPQTSTQPEEPSEIEMPKEAKKPAAGKPAASKAATARAAKLSKRDLRKKKAEERKIKAFHDYFDYREELRKIPPHRVLAINRGERARVLRVKIECHMEAMYKAVDEALVPAGHPHADYLRGCGRDALSRLILPSLEREIRRELTDRAEAHAVSVFARNLRNLLLQPPVRSRRVLAVDPGFKNGCKVVSLDQFGNALERAVIYLVGRSQRREASRQKALELINRYQLTVVAIGNGTACRECEDFFAALISRELKDRDVAYVIVNEAGASVYSTSRVGREEFPDYDASVRGAISIGRRLQDPLSELVKIDPASIGVGLYQHDVKAKHLRSSLDDVVESCVNYVGVDVNSASPALLRYVSGLNQLTARRIYEYRREHGPFRDRQQLMNVTGLGETSFVQAAGFLKISGGDNPLDATWIHPESYETATKVLGSLNCTVDDLGDGGSGAELAKRVAEVDLSKTVEELHAGELTLRDILTQLARPGRDPREDLPAPIFKQGIIKLGDLSPGIELTGTVLNVVDFGCFVDIGLHDSGLVHVSQLADKFIRDPHEVVAVGDIVNVWVKEIDKQRRRVSLTMVKPGSERPQRPQRGKKEESDQKQPADTDADRGERKDESRSHREPRRGAGAGPRRGARPSRPARPQYRPKRPPKPIVPITEDMKRGKEPMRTFGELMQFFNGQEENESPQTNGPQEVSKKAENGAENGDTNGAENADKSDDKSDDRTDQQRQQQPPESAE